MKSSLTVPQISRGRGAFTLVELTVAAGLFSVLALVGFSMMRSGLMLSSENLGLNVSSLRGRQMLDQISDKARYALTQPTLIDANGMPVAGASADGILIKKLVGSPYIVKEPGGTMAAIPATAKQFAIEFRATLAPPSVGDTILMETISRPELEISAVAMLAPVGTVQRRLITTTGALGEVAQPTNYRVSALLCREEAFVFLNTEMGTNPRAKLRHYPRVVDSTIFSSTSAYSEMGGGFRRLNSQPYFTNGTSNGAQQTTLAAVAYSSSQTEYVAREATANTFTSIPIQMRLWSLNR